MKCSKSDKNHAVAYIATRYEVMNAHPSPFPPIPV